MFRLNLRRRVLLILSGFVLITLLLGLTLVWYTFRMEGLLKSITEKDLAAFQNAEALENSLMRQKGLVSYYLLDGNSDWLKQEESLRLEFLDRMVRARDASDDPGQQQALDQLAEEYQQYAAQKRRVVDLYRSGDREAGAELHRDLRRQFESLIQRSAQFKEFHTQRILNAEVYSHAQAHRLRIISLAAIFSSAGLTVLLAFVFVYQILEPLRRLTLEAYRIGVPARSENEVKSLSRGVRVLLHDVSHKQSELERSRESLLQAEKMALIGKLAAGMAHSIRNPFTSVKMRLFSLGRSLDLDDAQKDDFEVISEEIQHIDTIVQNFLEFSRPPKLKMQSVSPSSVVDSALRLLEHRLKAYGVTVTVDRPIPLPLVRVDVEQLKEVLVNLVVNACEAMVSGGAIAIQERVDARPPQGHAAVIRVRDNGPGIPAHLLEQVFQPFFTTKEQGTGLGLSIAQRIVTEHGGRLEVESTEGQGSVFIITLSAQESYL
ncbi:MAG: ATP-binding protein [Hyphomicrobiales bacterium]